jgi:hypothetical protein
VPDPLSQALREEIEKFLECARIATLLTGSFTCNLDETAKLIADRVRDKIDAHNG